MNDAEFYRYVIHLNWTNRLGSQPLKHRPRPPRLHEIEEPRADHLDFCILYLLNSNEKQRCDTLIRKTKIENYHNYLGAILNWVAKVVWNFLGFALLRFLIGPENFRRFLNQLDENLKPNTTWSPAFTHTFPRFTHFWLCLVWVVIGSYGYSFFFRLDVLS